MVGENGDIRPGGPPLQHRQLKAQPGERRRRDDWVGEANQHPAERHPADENPNAGWCQPARRGFEADLLDRQLRPTSKGVLAEGCRVSAGWRLLRGRERGAQVGADLDDAILGPGRPVLWTLPIGVMSVDVSSRRRPRDRARDRPRPGYRVGSP